MPTLHEALAALPRPRKHYQWYYSTPAADTDMRHCPQGLHSFLRAYYHHKSADWAGNRPHELASWAATELAKMPTYYVMHRGADMAATVAEHMPSAAAVAACQWLPDPELRVYTDEFARTGFQGGLQWYRCGTTGLQVAEQQLFALAVGPVTPLRDANLAPLKALAPEPLPLQLWLDEERALLESISDDFDVATLLDTDDQLSFRRPGIGVEITRRLRAGHWSIQRQLDLHGLRIDEAREALGLFIRQSYKSGMRCVRVVHGKGLGSPGKTPVLKGRVQRWLVQKNEVLAFVQARPAEGGAGALVVLLQPSGPRRV